MIFESDEELMNQLNIMRTLKTIEMTPFVTESRPKENNCTNCKNWIGNRCTILGRIKNRKGYCSWYGEQNLKVKKVRSYLSLK